MNTHAKKCRCVSHEWIILSISIDFAAEDMCVIKPTRVRHQIFFPANEPCCLQLIKRNTMDFDTFTETLLAQISTKKRVFSFKRSRKRKKRLKVCDGVKKIE